MTRARTAGDFAYLDHEAPLAFAHRGGALYPPNVGIENSMAAFQAAVDLGYRYLETDVHATVDGVVLAFHDSSLDRTTDGSGQVAGLTYDEVSGCKIGGREKIPTIAELLVTWPDVRLNIDVKEPGAIEPLIRVLRQHRAFDRVCLASFSIRRIHRIRRLAGPDVATAYGPFGVAALWLAPGRALRRWLLRRPVPCVQVPRRVGPFELVTEGFVNRAHELGRQVHVWTVDDATEMRELLDLGVDGIITDRIDTLREVLTSRGQWKAGEA
ncbi:MAG: glycerophosphodiester phosphodiesterase [Propionibacteriales bacterium]|nr:glycerophosphodiester phosphodiesterase [Propionibacteriales bacterium]